MIIIIIMKKKNFCAKIVFGLLPNYIVKKKKICVARQGLYCNLKELEG